MRYLNNYNYIKRPLDASLDALAQISSASEKIKAQRGSRYFTKYIINYNMGSQIDKYI